MCVGIGPCFFFSNLANFLLANCKTGVLLDYVVCYSYTRHDQKVRVLNLCFFKVIFQLSRHPSR